MRYEGPSMEDLVALALLIVELTLLIATIILLYLSRHELEGRRRLVEHLMEVTRMLTRTQYFNAVLEAMRGASKEIFGSVTGAKPKDSTEFFDKIVKEIEAAVSRGVRIRYMMPKGREKLYVGYRYTKAGAEVRYHGGLVVYDLRHMVVDHRIVVMGFPEKIGVEQPTRTGIKVESESLAKIFKERFERLWEEAVPYENYLAHAVDDIKRTNPEISMELVAKQLELPVEEVEKVWDRAPRGAVDTFLG